MTNEGVSVISDNKPNQRSKYEAQYRRAKPNVVTKHQAGVRNVENDNGVKRSKTMVV